MFVAWSCLFCLFVEFCICLFICVLGASCAYVAFGFVVFCVFAHLWLGVVRLAVCLFAYVLTLKRVFVC